MDETTQAGAMKVAAFVNNLPEVGAPFRNKAQALLELVDRLNDALQLAEELEKELQMDTMDLLEEVRISQYWTAEEMEQSRQISMETTRA